MSERTPIIWAGICAVAWLIAVIVVLSAGCAHGRGGCPAQANNPTPAGSGEQSCRPGR